MTCRPGAPAEQVVAASDPAGTAGARVSARVAIERSHTYGMLSDASDYSSPQFPDG